MAELSVEDTVILWDCSRSMMRTDFKPSRLRVAQKLIKIFIEKKIAIDYKDSIAIALFGSRTKRISDFSSDISYLFGSLANFEIAGHSNVEDGIALALQLFGHPLLSFLLLRVILLKPSVLQFFAQWS